MPKKEKKIIKQELKQGIEELKESVEKAVEETKESVKKTVKKATPKNEFKLDPQEMIEAGLHFGHRISRRHPKMEPFIQGIRGTVHIIDLDKTVEKLQQALGFLKKIAEAGKPILLIGTKPSAKQLLKETAEECDLPYINERWLGGTFTNFDVIRKRVNYLEDIEKKTASGELDKYTKKERIKINRDLEKLKKRFSGLKKLVGLPEAIIVLDIRQDKLSVKEARMKGIKVIGVCDTNTDPSQIDYPIPANDDAISSIKYILDKIKTVILKAKTK